MLMGPGKSIGIKQMGSVGHLSEGSRAPRGVTVRRWWYRVCLEGSRPAGNINLGLGMYKWYSKGYAKSRVGGQGRSRDSSASRKGQS